MLTGRWRAGCATTDQAGEGMPAHPSLLAQLARSPGKSCWPGYHAKSRQNQVEGERAPGQRPAREPGGRIVVVLAGTILACPAALLFRHVIALPAGGLTCAARAKPSQRRPGRTAAPASTPRGSPWRPAPGQRCRECRASFHVVSGYGPFPATAGWRARSGRASAAPHRAGLGLSGGGPVRPAGPASCAAAPRCAGSPPPCPWPPPCSTTALSPTAASRSDLCSGAV